MRHGGSVGTTLSPTVGRGVITPPLTKKRKNLGKEPAGTKTQTNVNLIGRGPQGSKIGKNQVEPRYIASVEQPRRNPFHGVPEFLQRVVICDGGIPFFIQEGVNWKRGSSLGKVQFCCNCCVRNL